MSAHEIVELGLSERLPERAFSHPENSRLDWDTLCYMATRVRALCQEALPPAPRPLVRWLTESDGRRHRIAICNCEGLRTGRDLTVVGFFGQRRAGVDRKPINDVDEQLIEEFSEHPHILSYSTMQQPDGNSCNLVLLDDPAGLGHWRRSALHCQAVRMTPAYYESVRLHNGKCSGLLTAGGRLELIRTKYYDCRSDTLWRGVREFAPL